MNHIGNVFTLAPLLKLVDLHRHVLPVQKLSARPDSIPMVPGGGVAIPLVELYDPLVQSTNLVQPVMVTRGKGAIVIKLSACRLRFVLYYTLYYCIVFYYSIIYSAVLFCTVSLL